MLNSTQWTQVPRGASGSSQIRAKLFTPWGASLHLSGGDKFLSSLPCEAGIASPSLKAVLVSCMVGTPFGISGSELLLGFCSAQPVMSAIAGIMSMRAARAEWKEIPDVAAFARMRVASWTPAFLRTRLPRPFEDSAPAMPKLCHIFYLLVGARISNMH